jgi:hypothetical protein
MYHSSPFKNEKHFISSALHVSMRNSEKTFDNKRKKGLPEEGMPLLLPTYLRRGFITAKTDNSLKKNEEV